MTDMFRLYGRVALATGATGGIGKAIVALFAHAGATLVLGKGSIVVVASIAGLRANRAIGLYALSKAALTQLARNLAVGWDPQDVRTNTVAPGLTRAPFARPIFENQENFPRRLGLTPLRRAGGPEEIAAAIQFLASDAGGFVTGHTLVADGGTTIPDGN